MSFKNNRSLSGKIILVLIIACVTLVLSWLITNFSFQRIKEPVRKIAEPNPQLQLVNKLLKDVVKLDQLQRIQSSQEHVKNYRPFLKQSESIYRLLDTLQLLSAGNQEQLNRIDTMKSILKKRDKLFISYLNLRQDFLEKDTLTGKVQLLSDFVNNTALRSDSNIFTTESKITATTIEELDSNKDERQGFWDKLFKRKKAPVRKEVKHMILEQLNVSIDTLLLLHEDSVINQLSQSIAAIESGRQQSRNTLMRQRITLDRAGNSLISQLLIILNDMEDNELKRIGENNLLATNIINKGLQQISFVLIAFVLLTVILATLIFSDIARSNRYKKELIASRDEAEHLGNIKQKFLANMSHELRTPLQAIIGFSEQMKIDETERNQQNIDIVYQSSKHLLHVVNDVLDYSRISSGKLLLEEKPFDVKELVESVCATIELQARQKRLDFKYAALGLNNQLHTGDPFRLKQILFNLLNNAVKFTEKGNVELFVEVIPYKERSHFNLQISDTGIGIREDDMSRIFNHFEQLETAKMQEGSGLGLSIVKSLVENQGGSISVESVVGKGTVFNVSLTYFLAKNEDITIVQRNGDEATFKGTVWVVDDDTTILRLCSLILQKSKVKHACFSSASALLQAKFPDDLAVIFMDIRMPDMNGYELLQELRAQMKDKTVRYVALTAQSLPDERLEILNKGFSALLSKPFLAAELRAMISTEVVFPEENDAQDDLNDDEIWQSFFEETANDLAEIKQAVSMENFIRTADFLHRVAGRCGQMGLQELSKKSRLLEIKIRGGRYDQTEADVLLHDLHIFLHNRNKK